MPPPRAYSRQVGISRQKQSLSCFVFFRLFPASLGRKHLTSAISDLGGDDQM
ncbi:hypothetical protein TRIATDRAFT_296987 [Trichoderma atroviride IMI 206040]|uniref:Uncharacterized protein n=1 Tax=Hypocrea atroviridis (strain ATCC 20476 / IMI 206040) TaxID=452589 RepID=G9NF75_HYPAI|nr:uncharacterized protein TRIATDRAFT_296987 [Trichoderma atroviride IMI 206040]EHK50591.1 hypothetical protein TRIATDRAFT_296987 [Trichoderma atroviride IMI 206040]